jgi:phospholipid/cholesterol/gamma-HCH transport system ATP-binding protein
MNEPLIQFVDVHKRFGENRVLKGVNLTIPRGRITALIGAHGSGKSVLLKLMAGLMVPDSGQILFDGRPFDAMDTAGKTAFRRQLGYVFSHGALFDDMTVLENIGLPLGEGAPLPVPDAGKRVQDMIRHLDLGGNEARYPAALSAGVTKQVALARALVTRPELVLFDDPTIGLAPMGKHAILAMIADCRRRSGFSGVVACHEIPAIFLVAGRVALLHQGKIGFEGSAESFAGSLDPAIGPIIEALDRSKDDLTGLDSQSEGEKTFARERARLQRHRAVFSIVSLCVENMDEINREMGYEAGQGALRQFAGKVRKHVRVSDACARSGLSRILLILPNTDLVQARRVCAKLAQGLTSEEPGRKSRPDGFSLSVSAGFAEADKESRLGALIARAESMLTKFYDFDIQ